MKLSTLAALLLVAASSQAFAQTYTLDPSHTYPSFAVDHMGISVWRGKFTKTSGTVTIDKEKKTGSVNVVVDTNSIDMGHDKLNEHLKGADFFNVEKYPTATFKAENFKFKDGAPVAVNGEITMLGVTKPAMLHINRFKCIMHPMLKREVCGADVTGVIRRTDFGMNTYATPADPLINLAIQVEGIKVDPTDAPAETKTK